MFPCTSISAGPMPWAAEPLRSGRKVSLRSVIRSVVLRVMAPLRLSDTGPTRETTLPYRAGLLALGVGELTARLESTEPRGTPIRPGLLAGFTGVNEVPDW